MTVQEAAARLRQMNNVLLLTHVRPDGDTIGSAAALCQALRDMGKTAYLLYNPEITDTYAPYAEPYWASEGFVPEHIVSADIAALNLLPDNAAAYASRVELTIDHHGSQGFFAAETCLDADAAACGEIIYRVIRELTAVTPAIALLLYVAISTDTGCFVYANTTADTHRIAAELLETGIDVGPVNKVLFRTKSKTRLAMEARMVADMELYDGDRVVVMSIPLSLRQELHATEADIEELSSLAALVEGTDCGITLRELKPGRVKLSLRTGPRVDACAVCQRLGGGGHTAAAGATVDGTLEDAKALTLKAYRAVVG
ncbi:MAG: phosphoesterase RecJ domain-containing protein [Clostridiales bacterium]|nr:phosphoesterase RecJ domain-containing protein [Clostridiales bacterium]